MLDYQVSDDLQKLDETIDYVLTKMKLISADTPEYAAALKNLKTLYDIKDQLLKTQIQIEETQSDIDNSNKPKKMTFSGDAILGAGASLAGILAIISYEKFHVVTSKALGFVLKTKI